MQTYVIESGAWYNNAVLLGVGYSGHDLGVNNALLESEVNIGPVPSGQYKLAVVDKPDLGKEPIIQLVPDLVTRNKIILYERDPDSFFCHGDDIHHPGEELGSHGCIVQDHTVRVMIVQCIADGDSDLQVLGVLE